MKALIEPYKDLDALSTAVADWLSRRVASVLRTEARFTLVLSGGSTPERLYALLAREPYRSGIAWEKIHVFWGDERYVPFDDSRHNGRMAQELLLSQVPVPADQVHYMDTTLPPEESAARYAALLHDYFGESGPTFDLVLLGMGDDGHTLSLFPGSPLIHEQSAWVAAPFVEKQDMYRITLTAPVVNRAAAVAFLAAGAGKARTLQAVIEGAYQPDTYPSQCIRPVAGELHWFVDQAASALLAGR